MYRHWSDNKRKILDIIASRQSAVCQVSYGTNYSIFFRNIHSDLLLKKNILPIYVDLNHLSALTTKALHCLVLTSIKRTLLEKKVNMRVDFEEAEEVLIQEKIKMIVSDKSIAAMSIVFFFEDTDIILPLGVEAFALFNDIRNAGLPCSFIYLMKTNISHPDNLAKYRKAPHLYENVLYFQLKDKKTLRTVEKAMSPKVFNTIFELTGGVDLFHGVAIDLKNNLSTKERKNLDTHLKSNWHLRHEMHNLWKTFSESEVRALSRVVWKSPEIEENLQPDIDHLLKLGILQKSGKNYEFSIGLLRYVGIEKSKEKQAVIEYASNKLVVNGTNVPVKLNDVEKKILKQFLTNKNKIIARSNIAKSIWNGQHTIKYNDGVIDETVSKLKNKLSEAWINPNNLVAVEDKGFIYRE